MWVNKTSRHCHSISEEQSFYAQQIDLSPSEKKALMDIQNKWEEMQEWLLTAYDALRVGEHPPEVPEGLVQDVETKRQPARKKAPRAKKSSAKSSA